MILQENNVDLQEVADKMLSLDVEDIIDLDNKGETRLFNNTKECFYYVFVEDNTIGYLASQIINTEIIDPNKPFFERMLDTSENVVILDDGRALFIYL